MMALDSAVVILMAEALAALLLLAIIGFWLFRHRQGKEMAEIDNFISHYEDQAFLKTERLEQFLKKDCGLAPAAIETVLQTIDNAERALFQDVIRLLLKRELNLLNDIEQQINNLAEPYQNLLAHREPLPAQTSAAGAEGDSLDKLTSMERINQQLIRQLDTAMKTIDEISAEYTRVFSGNQTALELENSSKKMQQIFADAEHHIRQSIKELEG